jgi:hypothetical protein
MRRGGMTVKNGKFYKDDKEVPIEHGNKEQIAILSRIQNYINEGEEPSIREVRHIECVSKCPCGAFFEFSDLELEEDEPLDMLAGKTVNCHNCGVEYKLACDEYGDLVVRMIAKEKGKVQVEGISNG